MLKDACLNGHTHAVRECPVCGTEFCSGCSNSISTKLRKLEAGFYAPTWMICPKCSHDFYGALTSAGDKRILTSDYNSLLKLKNGL